MSLDRIALSSRSLGYGQGIRDVIQVINTGAGVSKLDKPTLLWMLEQVDALRKVNETRGDAIRTERKDAAA